MNKLKVILTLVSIFGIILLAPCQSFDEPQLPNDHTLIAFIDSLKDIFARRDITMLREKISDRIEFDDSDGSLDFINRGKEKFINSRLPSDDRLTSEYFWRWGQRMLSCKGSYINPFIELFAIPYYTNIPIPDPKISGFIVAPIGKVEIKKDSLFDSPTVVSVKDKLFSYDYRKSNHSNHYRGDENIFPSRWIFIQTIDGEPLGYSTWHHFYQIEGPRIHIMKVNSKWLVTGFYQNNPSQSKRTR